MEKFPIPNHSTNSGTQAKEGIGIKTLSVGEIIFSTVREFPIQMPSGTAITNATASPIKTRAIVTRVCPKIIPAEIISVSFATTAPSGGVSATEKSPLLANTSQRTKAPASPAIPRKNADPNRRGVDDARFAGLVMYFSPCPIALPFCVRCARKSAFPSGRRLGR